MPHGVLHAPGLKLLRLRNFYVFEARVQGCAPHLAVNTPRCAVSLAYIQRILHEQALTQQIMLNFRLEAGFLYGGGASATFFSRQMFA
jgi:hypothetical protein